MPFQFFRLRGTAMRFQVGGRRCQDAPVVGHAPRHQARIGQLAHADRQVEVAAIQILHLIGQAQVETDPGMQAAEIVDSRGHELAPERRGRGQADSAAQFLAAAGRQFLHFFQHRQGHPCALGDGAAFAGDAQVTGVALEQRGAQRLFQPGDLLADRLRREVQVACGGGKAVALHNMHEHR